MQKQGGRVLAAARRRAAPLKSLKIECPLCGARGSKRIVRINPAMQELPARLHALFSKATGSMPGYRIRVRQCEKCGQPLACVEFALESLNTLIGEISSLTMQRRRAFSIIEKVRHAVGELESLFPTEQRAAKMLQENRGKAKRGKES